MYPVIIMKCLDNIRGRYDNIRGRYDIRFENLKKLFTIINIRQSPTIKRLCKDFPQNKVYPLDYWYSELDSTISTNVSDEGGTQTYFIPTYTCRKRGGHFKSSILGIG